MTTTYTHRIEERGNGFPSIGERIYDSEGNVLVVKEMSSLHTIQYQSNYVFAECETTGEDWFDVEENEKDEFASDSYGVSQINNYQINGAGCG